MKILHAADIHARDKDIEETERCLNCVVDIAETQDVDLVVIAGDTFDSRDVKLDSKSAKLVVKTVSALAEIAPVAIVIGTPSHDGLAAEILRYAKGLYPVIVADVPKQVYLSAGSFLTEDDDEGFGIHPELILTLVPQPTKQFFNQGDIQTSNEAIAHGMAGLFAGFGAQASEYNCPHILIYHGSISGAKLSNSQTLTGMDIEISADQISLANPDVVLCGHIHLPQELPGNVFYSGSIYANNWGENHKHGFYIHEIEAV